ncbi:hypothetical protein GH863_30715 [Bacillus thuringiensis]|nr:hypothetical protein [Bacillus thuringiensis]MRD45506.1 hypothetical protein [Bacillus thuringiensis]
MKLVTTQITDNLSLLYPNINWYVNFVPEADAIVPNLPIGRVVELNMDYEEFASDLPLYIDSTVQLDVWFDKTADAEDFYYAVDQFFLQQGCSVLYSEITTDPDIENKPRIIKRYLVRRHIDLG